MQLLGRHHWKTIGQIKPHLAAKYGARARSRAVRAFNPIIENVLKEIEILFHQGQAFTRIYRMTFPNIPNACKAMRPLRQLTGP